MVFVFSIMVLGLVTLATNNPGKAGYASELEAMAKRSPAIIEE